MQHREHHLKGWDALLRVTSYGYATPVVRHGHGVVRVNGNGDLRTKSRHGLVHGVVHDLPYQVVQAARTRGTDVHARSLAHGVQAFEDLDRVLSVPVLLLLCHVIPLCVAHAWCGRRASRPQALDPRGAP